MATQHRIARITVAAAALGAGGAAAALTTGTATAATHPSATRPAARTAAPLATTCTTEQLTGSLTNVEGTAGGTGATLELTNTSDRSCVVYGYPGVSWISTAGTQVGQPAARTPGAEPEVLLAPGRAAQATLLMADPSAYPGGCGLTPTSALQVYPPDQATALDVPEQATTCANPADVTLQIGPLTPVADSTAPTA